VQGNGLDFGDDPELSWLTFQNSLPLVARPKLTFYSVYQQVMNDLDKFLEGWGVAQ